MRIGTQPKPNVTERWLRRAERRTELINTRDLVDGGEGDELTDWTDEAAGLGCGADGQGSAGGG